MTSNEERPTVESLEPIADASEWIEQLSKPYGEVPWAVIRELFQNASDAVQENSDDQLRLIEMAILSKEKKQAPDNFHFVIRDSGQGMSREGISKYLRVLGVGTKKSVAKQIGQYGVGFFSTHAICLAVRIVSRKIDTQETIGWDYIPGLKRFFQIDENDLESIVAKDFDNHPDETRRRTHGTSVYLNLKFDDYPQCEEWLIAESLLNNIRRDFFILPSPIYIADYSEGYPGRKILDGTGQEVHEKQVNLEDAPWNVEGNRQDELATDLLQFKLPHYKRSDLPNEWIAFDERVGVGDARVSGFMWLANIPHEGAVDLLLKRMWVESARDVHPPITTPAFGVFDITPQKNDLDVDVSPQRDHIIRDTHFRTARRAMQRGLVGLFEKAGERCVHQIREAVVSLPDVVTKIDATNSILSKSSFMKIMQHDNISYGNLLSDIPLTIDEIIKSNAGNKSLIEFAIDFVNVRISKDIESAQLKGALSAMQETADKKEIAEELAVMREPLQWTPTATRDFLARVGQYLPVPLVMRERRTDGGFNVRQITVPLMAIPALNPASASKILVLTKGSVVEFLSKETSIGGVIYPADLRINDDTNSNFCLFLAIISSICKGIPDIEFVEHNRELLKSVVNRDDFIPLIECLSSIVNAVDERGSGTRIEVDAQGYLGEKSIPLVYDKSDDGHRLIINAYNSLVQDLMTAYTNAGERNDTEARELISHICHELYHHALPVEHEQALYEHHAVTTRNTLFVQTISILRKYADVRQ